MTLNHSGPERAYTVSRSSLTRPTLSLSHTWTGRPHGTPRVTTDTTLRTANTRVPERSVSVPPSHTRAVSVVSLADASDHRVRAGGGGGAGSHGGTAHGCRLCDRADGWGPLLELAAALRGVRRRRSGSCRHGGYRGCTAGVFSIRAPVENSGHPIKMLRSLSMMGSSTHTDHSITNVAAALGLLSRLRLSKVLLICVLTRLVHHCRRHSTRTTCGRTRHSRRASPAAWCLRWSRLWARTTSRPISAPPAPRACPLPAHVLEEG